MIRSALLVLVALACSWCVQAQVAPEGNAHPRMQSVSDAPNAIPNPFGELTRQDPAPREAKRAFAQAVDLEALRPLAVQHNGRVKILDTLARETVAKIMGRKTYLDYFVAEGTPDRPTKVDTYAYDPLFTLLDLTIDPAYYLDKPLIAVNYLPLRQALVEKEFPKDEAARERYLKLTRISPVLFMRHAEAVRDERMNDRQTLEAFDQLADALKIWQYSGHNFLVVPPADKADAWLHLSTLPETHPARRAALELGTAWRARDAAAASQAARTLAAELPKLQPAVYPAGARGLELLYNKSNAFEWGWVAYISALVVLIIAFGTGRKVLIGLGTTLLVSAVLLHGFGFVSRCLIAERFAIQNQFESMTGLSLFAAVVGLAIMLKTRRWLYGAAAAGVGFLVLVTATQTSIPGKFIEREAAILNTSVLLKYHVTTVLVSYGLIALGFITSLFYLAAHYAGALARTGEVAMPGGGSVSASALGLDEQPASRARLLADLDTAQMTVLQLAFWTLGVGILLGAWWADHSWGRWWAFDPKETWALITWIVYLIAIHVRFTTTRNRALITAWLSVAGFVVMIWTYFGVNLLLPGLHAYA